MVQKRENAVTPVDRANGSWSVEVDRVSKEDWTQILLGFRDATINQTWSFAEGLSGPGNLSHLVLKRGDDIAAAAQVRIKKLPLIKAGIAYLPWGPLWQVNGEEQNLEALCRILRALRRECAERRRLYLLVRPHVWDTDDDAASVRSVFEAEGYDWKQSADRTLLLDLKPSLEELRKSLHKKWRKNLREAERNGLRVREGTSRELFEEFKRVYIEMVGSKCYPNPVDIDCFARTFDDLPEVLKPRVVICDSDGEPMAGGIFSTVGDTGIWVLGATGVKGRKCGASYRVQWKMLESFREEGFRRYDLGSVNPEKVPGTYRFKAGLCGKRAEPVRRVGEFTACDSAVAWTLAKAALRAREGARWFRSRAQSQSCRRP